MRPHLNASECGRFAALALCASLAGFSFAQAQAATGGDRAASRPPVPHTHRHVAANSLEDRVALLSKALDLDAAQQAGLRRVLEQERERIAKAWSDPAVPAAYRIIATQAASEQTADEIRALLNEEQKKRYKPPRSSIPEEARTRPDVEAWMTTGKPK